MLNYRQSGDTIDFTNGYGTTINRGTLVLQQKIVCIPINDVANGATGKAKTEGVFNVPCSGAVANIGLRLFLNDTTHKVSTSSGPTGSGGGQHIYAGTAFSIAGHETASYCYIKLAGAAIPRSLVT